MPVLATATRMQLPPLKDLANAHVSIRKAAHGGAELAKATFRFSFEKVEEAFNRFGVDTLKIRWKFSCIGRRTFPPTSKISLHFDLVTRAEQTQHEAHAMLLSPLRRG